MKKLLILLTLIPLFSYPQDYIGYNRGQSIDSIYSLYNNQRVEINENNYSVTYCLPDSSQYGILVFQNGICIKDVFYFDLSKSKLLTISFYEDFFNYLLTNNYKYQKEGYYESNKTLLTKKRVSDNIVKIEINLK